MPLSQTDWDILSLQLQAGGFDPSSLSENDRALAKEIYDHKRHLGPLGMIEVAIVLGRRLRELETK